MPFGSKFSPVESLLESLGEADLKKIPDIHKNNTVTWINRALVLKQYEEITDRLTHLAAVSVSMFVCLCACVRVCVHVCLYILSIITFIHTIFQATKYNANTSHSKISKHTIQIKQSTTDTLVILSLQ